MKKIIVVIIVLIIGAAAWLLISHGSNSKPTSSPSTNSTQSQSASPPPNAQPVSTNSVKMLNIAFSPANITVKKGTTVTWTNQDAVEHTVTENDGKNGPSAPPLSQGQSYTFTFNDTGTFHYHCTIHSEMSGTVTVTEN